VTGLDFSPKSLTEANKLAAATIGSGGEKIKFVESSVYDALNVLPEGHFDLVFTGVGAICWIYSIQNWAEVVSKLLKKGGRLFIREGHPMLWTLEDKRNDLLEVKYPYFEQEKPTMFEDTGTYVGGGQHKFENNQSVEFNHGIGEIIQALLDHGMRITAMEEHQSVPWEALPGQMTKDKKNGTQEYLQDVACILLTLADRVDANRSTMATSSFLHPPGCQGIEQKCEMQRQGIHTALNKPPFHSYVRCNSLKGN
jgi:SAM-dependent methyltransferase